MNIASSGSASNADKKASIGQFLVERGQIPANAEWCMLSGGRTNTTWHVSDVGLSLVVKLYAQLDRNPLFPNDYKQEEALLTYLAHRDISPRFVFSGQSDVGPVLVYQHLEGNSWTSQTHDVGRLLFKLHETPVPRDLRSVPNGSAEIEHQTMRILSRCYTPYARTIALQRPAGKVSRSDVKVLLHGDPVPGNIVGTPSGLRLIDWQCPAEGDPCEDLALFLSPAMQMAYRGSPLKRSEIESFLTSYPNQTTVERYRRLVPWYHWRMMAYCLWKQEQGHANEKEYGQLEATYLVA